MLLTVDHLLNLSAGKLANSVGDGNIGSASRGLLSSCDLEDTVDVDLEDNFQSSLASAHGRDRSESEFTKRGVVLAVSTFTLVDGELDGLLVVNDSGEGTLLDGGDGLTTGNNGGEDVTLHGDTEGEGNNIEKEEVRGLLGGGLSTEDTSLNGGTVGNSLIRVDALLELLSVKEVAEQLLDTGNTGRTTDEDNLVNSVLGNTRVLQDLLNRLKGASESLGIKVLKTSTSDLSVEILAIKEGVNFNSGLGSVGKSTLGTLTSGTETTQSTGVVGKIWIM